jgi:SAM-dependent methyltransferase
LSQIDREKWDRRYREGAYAERRHPNVFLAESVKDFPVGRALDLACGAGRNALFLAGLGYQLDAIDISAEALSRGENRAQELGAKINWLRHDLDEPLRLEGGYQLILLIHYVNLSLLQQLGSLLAPRGILLCEEHLETSEQVVGPSNPAFRVRPGELREAAAGLDILFVQEGLVTEPDGRRAALSRLIARKL